MPRPPNCVGYDDLQPTVIAIGVKTEYGQLLLDSFPSIANCCLDVRSAFSRKWDENSSGTGFDLSTRRRIVAKKAWRFVSEIAMSVLAKFGLLIVVCNHGKHRSLSLACELAYHTKALIITPRDKQGYWQYPEPLQFLSRVTDRLRQHRDTYPHCCHPFRRIGIVEVGFDCSSWAIAHQVDAAEYCSLFFGDIVVEISPPNEEAACGWGYGIMFRGSDIFPGCWFPPAYVRDLQYGHIQGAGYFGEDLLSNWTKYCKYSRSI